MEIGDVRIIAICVKCYKKYPFFENETFDQSTNLSGKYQKLRFASVTYFQFSIKLYRGSEWGHLDNTKHLIFWLCNMKQLNFKHFNINSKKLTVTVNFSQKDTKTAPKRPILFCLVYQEVFSHFATIPDHFGRFPKTAEDYRRCLHITEDFRGEIRKFSTIFRRYIHM